MMRKSGLLLALVGLVLSLSGFSYAEEAQRPGVPWWVWVLIPFALLAFLALVIWWYLRGQEEAELTKAPAPHAPHEIELEVPAPERVAEELPAVEVEAPAAPELPAVEVEAPAAPELPAVEVEAPAAPELPAVEVEELPAVPELPAVEVEELPAAPELPAVEVEAPAVTEPPAVRLAEVPAVPEPPAVHVGPDDLKVIEGIGPKIAGILRAAGILTFAQLAATDPDRIREILAEANPNLLRLADPTTWPEQAALAAAGNWDGLRELQDSLTGGRR